VHCRRPWIWIVLGAGWGLSGVAAAPPESKVERARTALRAFLDQRFDDFLKGATEKMHAALGPDKLREIDRQIRRQFGEPRRIGPGQASRSGPFDVVVFPVTFERAVLRMQIVFDDQRRLAGFFIRGVEPLKPWQPPDYVRRDAFRESDVTVRSGGFELPGKLCVPVTRAKHPAVVFVHGSGPHDADETVMGCKPFRDLGWGLASRGIVTLRYVKRTQAHAARIDPQTLTLDEETIDDAVAALELLRARPEVDPQRVFVLGHSLGGMAAPLIAAKAPWLAGVIVLSGSARPILDLASEQIEYLAKTDGRISPDEQEQIDQVRQTIRRIRAGQRGPELTLLGAPAAYWARLDRIDGPAAARRVRLPMLIIGGGRDFQVTRADFELWRKALAGRADVQFRWYPKLNPLLVSGEGPSSPQEYLKPGHVDVQVIGDIAAWIERVASQADGTGP